MRNGIINNRQTQVKLIFFWIGIILVLLFITLLRSRPAGSRPVFASNRLRGTSPCNQPLAVTSAKAGRPYLPGLAGIIFLPERTGGLAQPDARTYQSENKPPQTADNETHIFTPTAAGPSIWANGPPENNGSTPLTTDWVDDLLDKIWMVESSKQLAPLDGDDGQAIGPLQIHADVLIDVNGKFGTRFTIADLRDIGKAKIVARMYIELWMEKHKEEIAARIFKGGPRGWSEKSTDNYWRKIDGR